MGRGVHSTRREFLRLTGAAGGLALAGLLGARSVSAEEEFGGGQEIHTVEPEEKGGVLNYFTWNGYDADRVLNPFRERYDCTVNIELLTSDPDAILKLKAGGTRQFHLITLNNVWSKGMYRDGLIIALDNETYRPYFDKMIPRYQWPFQWAMSDDTPSRLLGMPQRYGPFNFVVNTNAISKETAQSEGWELFNDPANKGKWALLNWDNWVLYQMSQASGVYPFKKHDDDELARVEETAYKWFEYTKFVTESEVEANNALINGEIMMYVCGGNYTASPPRLEGRWEVTAITPRKGTMKNGGGGIVWLELTNIINNPKPSNLADDFLAYMQEPDAAYNIAMADSTHNPVANMGDPQVLAKFSKEELDSFQYDDLEEDLKYCEDYNDNPDYLEMMKFYRKAKASRG